ncbi:MAG: choice-of-anchor L domain-containing protein [Anaerolineae bacterium]|nr:choice-of-anchor L domain-containing protein [Anaerolineae bacterium]
MELDVSGLPLLRAPEAAPLIAASLIADGSAKAGVGASPIGAFPIAGGTYVYLGTGNMIFANQANSAPNTFGLGRGATLALTMTVPTTATCMAFDFGFYSEEFPEFVGSAFNDTFDAFIDGAPFARDSQGNRISINSVFGATAGNAAGSTYDGATPRLRAQTPVTPGATAVVSFTISDTGDDSYDSAVLIDRLRFGRPVEGGCEPGASLPYAVALVKTVGAQAGLCAPTQAITVTRNTLVNYCYSVVNSGDLTLSTHSLYDPLFGNLLTDQPLSLVPGGTFSLTRSVIVTQAQNSLAVWMAYTDTSHAFSTTSASSARVNLASAGDATLLVSPPITTARIGVPVTVAVWITGALNFGSFETVLAFDPALVTATQVIYGDFAGSTGRSVLSVPVVHAAGSVRFGQATIGGAPGPSGGGVLAWVTFTPLMTGTTALTLSQSIATSVSSDGYALTLQNGGLIITQTKRAFLPLVLRGPAAAAQDDAPALAGLSWPACWPG